MFNIGILKNYVFKGAYSKVERSFWECCFVSFFCLWLFLSVLYKSDAHPSWFWRREAGSNHGVGSMGGTPLSIPQYESRRFCLRDFLRINLFTLVWSVLFWIL